MKTIGIGLDFGTTNSSLAFAYPDGRRELLRFPTGAGSTESYRSLLYLERVRTGARSTLKSWTGPAGIERYLEADEKGRLIQSLKSFLTSKTLRSTEIFGRQTLLEELIANILRDLRAAAERHLNMPVRDIVVGRPVRFVGAEKDEDDAFAVTRLEQALRTAGFEGIQFEFEPIGAACHYEATLTRDELILIGDFGGGTSDFSLLRVGPSVLRRGRQPSDLLGNEGVGIAGDAFDARIVRHCVSPALGSDSLMDSFGKLLPVPRWMYFKLERWHHLSLLRSAEALNMLESVRAQALDPTRIEALLTLIRHDLGYHLHQAVQRTKCLLSGAAEAPFHFDEEGIELNETVTRADFEAWISDELQAIADCVDRLVLAAGVRPQEISNVFLTGGSSLVPAVRRIFETRFGAERIRTGGEFTSVASGLALRALERQGAPVAG